MSIDWIRSYLARTLVALLFAFAACDEEPAAGGKLHPGPCVQENDNNADGRVDVRIVYSYDDAGRLVLRETDSEPEGPDDLDGVPEGASYYHYEGDLLALKEVDYGADGTVEQRYDFHYDADDFLVLVEVRSEPDGELEAEYEFANDAHGNVLEAVFSYYVADVTEQDIERYAYDADDNLISEEYVFDAHEDTAVDERRFHVLDADGLRYRTDLDLDGDFVTDAETFYTYDSRDLLVLEETDDGPDQTIDLIETYEYDGGGNLTRYARDDWADGVEDAIQAFGYDCW